MISPGELDHLMDRGWSGLSVFELDGWMARVSGGVTQRANSVLPVHAPGDVIAAIEHVELLYYQQGLNPTFQISPAAKPGNLDAILEGRGYELCSPTLVEVADLEHVLQRLRAPTIAVTINDEPSDEWMRLWWSVDGRGGDPEKALAHRILRTCPSTYASISHRGSVVAVARLARVDVWGGIYCMAVRPDVRRRGYAQAVLHELLMDASSHSGIQSLWLQVVAENLPARDLYERSGFAVASRYHYRRKVSSIVQYIAKPDHS